MTWRIPDWYGLILLSLAAFRVWKLVGEDTILDRLRNRMKLIAFKIGGPKGKDYLEALLECPWCAGFWISLGWWFGWAASPRWALVAALPFAISALVGTVAHFTSE